MARLMPRAARIRSNFFSVVQQQPVRHEAVVGEYSGRLKRRESRQIRFFLGNFFEFLGNCQLEIPWQGHTPKDAGENLFHCFSAFWGGNKLADRLLAFR